MDPPGDPDTHLRLRTTDLCPTRAGGAPLNGWVGMNANLSLSNKQRVCGWYCTLQWCWVCLWNHQIRSDQISRSVMSDSGFESLFSPDHFFFLSI